MMVYGKFGTVRANIFLKDSGDNDLVDFEQWFILK